jgi:DNA-binding GntR family transcriptional regulator
MRRIEDGTYAVGGMLPTELTLCDEYQVSRHTIREALRRLRDAGLIKRRRRIGTEVVARRPPDRYRQPTNSIRDFLQYTEDARLEVLNTTRILAEAALAEQLECEEGHAWLEIESLRSIPGNSRPICFTTAYVDAELMPIDQRLDKLEGPVSALLERVYGVHIGRIDQAIDAVALSRRHAKLLRAAAGGPALRAVRRYYDPNGRLFELSIALHPGDRFSYVTSLIGQ